MIMAIVGALVVSAILWFAGTKFSPAWEKREMDNFAGKWNLLFGLGTLFALLASVGSFALGAPVWGAVAFSIIAWLIPLVSATDYTTLLIPREICIVAYYLPLPLVVMHSIQEGSWSPLINMGIWLLAVAVMFIPVMMGRLGMGDLRLFILFGTALAWWAGAYYVVLGLLAACILQIFVFILAATTKKIGVYREVRPLTDETDTLDNTVEQPEASGEIRGRHKAIDETVPQPVSKKRLFVPFGPALLYGALAAGLAAAYLPYEELLDALVF